MSRLAKSNTRLIMYQLLEGRINDSISMINVKNTTFSPRTEFSLIQ